MKKTLLFLGLILVALFAHMLVQYRLFSIFQAIMAIPLFIMVTQPFRKFLALFAFVALELFSSLPPGSILLMFAIPYLVLFVWKKLRVEFSWKFLFGTTLMVTLQSLALIGILAIMDPSFALQFPWSIILMQILVTSLGSFILSFIYTEYADRL